MPTNTLQKLEEINQILCRCEQLKGDLLSLRGDNIKSYTAVFTRNELLKRIDLYFFQIYVIQICTILNPKEHHSLRKIMLEVLADPITNWQYENSKEEMQKAIDKLGQLESRHLESLKVLRDKYWVHRDEDRESYATTFQRQAVLEILPVLQDCYNVAMCQLKNSTTRFDILSDRDPSEFLHLARYSKIWERLRPEWSSPGSEIEKELIAIITGRQMYE